MEEQETTYEVTLPLPKTKQKRNKKNLKLNLVKFLDSMSNLQAIQRNLFIT